MQKRVYIYAETYLPETQMAGPIFIPKKVRLLQQIIKNKNVVNWEIRISAKSLTPTHTRTEEDTYFQISRVGWEWDTLEKT